MKNKFSYNKLLFILIVSLIFSCSDSHEDEEEPPTAPVLTIVEPADGSSFAPGEGITITISAEAQTDIQYVKFYVQDEVKEHLETPPFYYIWDTGDEPEGTCIIKVVVCDQNELQSTQSVTIYIAKPRYTVSFSGVVKSRQNDENLSGINILLEQNQVSSGTGGEYSIGGQLTEGSYALRVEATKSCMGTNYGFDLTEDATKTTDLYLYQKPASVNKKGISFIKGVSMFDAGPWMGQDLFPDVFSSTFDELSAMNSNLITVFDPVFVTVAGTDTVKMSTTANTEYEWDMLSLSQYETLTDLASQKGLNFMYWFGVWPQEEEQLSGKSFNSIVFGGEVLSDAFWDDWFAEYSRILVDYAKIAESKNVPYISLGHGLNYATSPSQFSSEDLYNTLWTKLIGDLREFYSGDIVYFGTNRPFSAQNYEGGTEVEYYEDGGYNETFKNLFDAFGIIISNITTTEDPTVAQLKSAVTDIFSRYENFEKPIILWVWSPSVDGSANRYGHLEPVLDVNTVSSNFEVNFYEQADVYEGIMEAVNETDLDILGIISHGYMYFDQFEKYEPRNMNTAFNKAASVRNKPAEEILKFWFGNM